MGDAAHHAFQNAPITFAVFGIVKRAEADGIHHGDRPRTHREDVAQNAANACGRALERFNKAGVVVRFNLERHAIAAADVDDARVLAGAEQHVFRFRRQLLQMHTRTLIGAVLAPHDAENTELRNRRSAAKQGDDLVVLAA